MEEASMQEIQREPCPYCRELILPGAVKCKECGSSIGRRWSPGQSMVWARNQPDRKVLGVAACIASNFRVSPTIVRLTFVLLTFVSLLGLVLYLALAAVIPAGPGRRSMFEAAVDAVGAALDNFRNPPARSSHPATRPTATAPAAPPPPPSGEPQNTSWPNG